MSETIYTVLNLKGGRDGDITFLVCSFLNQIDAETYVKENGSHLVWVMQPIIGMVEYKETLNTDKKLMLDLLEANIKAVDMMAATMLNPHTEYPEFERLMKILIDGYR